MLEKRQATYEDLLMERFLREREQGLIIWTTKDKTQIAINRMSDQHLQNAIKLIEHSIEHREIEGDIGDLEDALG